MKRGTFSFFACLFCLVAFPSGQSAGRGPTGGSLDRLVRSREALRGNAGALRRATGSGLDGKCGLGLALAIRDNWSSFSSDQKRRLQAVLEPPPTQKSRILGRFRIFYDTTGFHAPALLAGGSIRIPNSYEAYVDSVGAAFNHVWEYEIGVLGYDEPPFEFGQDSYNIYVQELGQSLYGLTQDVEQIPGGGPPRYTSYIEIDNDFLGFFSAGIAGLQVTAAHEFHHAIQLGAYGYWGTSDVYFLEITSTWMEDVVFDEVNDYYQYLETLSGSPLGQFLTPDISFTLSDPSVEYSRAVWGKFIEKRFSRDVMRRSWEAIRSVPAFPALDIALTAAGSSFRSAFLEFSYWNFRTGTNADTANFYTEGKSYPDIAMRAEVSYIPPGLAIADSVGAVSSAYHPIRLPQGSMIAIISNLNGSLAGSLSRFGFVYSLGESSSGGAKQLSNGLYAALIVGDPRNWSSQETVPSVVPEVVVFPNPFSPKENKPLKFRLPSASQPTARLDIFRSSFDRVFSGDRPVIQLRPLEPGIEWDGHDTDRDAVGTGVYFFVISVDDREYTGKFTVIKE